MTVAERIQIHSKIVAGQCWEWQRKIDKHGYGIMGVGSNTSLLAHRVAYEVFKGPIPEGLTIDHLCRNRSCVNPDHLEAVSKWENTRRGKSPSAINSRKEVCINGHLLSGGNLYTNSRGWRTCRTCHTAKQRLYRSLRKRKVAQ